MSTSMPSTTGQGFQSCTTLDCCKDLAAVARSAVFCQSSYATFSDALAGKAAQEMCWPEESFVSSSPPYCCEQPNLLDEEIAHIMEFAEQWIYDDCITPEAVKAKFEAKLRRILSANPALKETAGASPRKNALPNLSSLVGIR